MKLTLALRGADGSLVVGSRLGRTLDAEILTSLRLVRTTGTIHTLTPLSDEVLARPARLCTVHHKIYV